MLGSLFPFDDYEAFLSLLHSLLRNPHHLLSEAENGETAYVSVSTCKKSQKYWLFNTVMDIMYDIKYNIKHLQKEEVFLHST